LFAIALHTRFEALKEERSDREILSCRTWAQFCDEVLGYSARHVRRLMGAENPAGKYRNKTRRGAETEGFDRSEDTGAAMPSAVWSDAKFINTCVRFVQRTLKPLETSDPQRFHRLAVAIAKAIAEDFLEDDAPVF
jgi:hypothetical protein